MAKTNLMALSALAGSALTSAEQISCRVLVIFISSEKPLEKDVGREEKNFKRRDNKPSAKGIVFGGEKPRGA